MSDQLKKVLEVKNLKQYFSMGYGKNKLVVKAVDDISFDIFEGEVFGLVGESGCGKTTTGRSIIKLYEATDGEVFFKDKRIGGGIETQKENIRNIKEKAKNEILSHQPKKLKEQEIKLTYKADVNQAKYKYQTELEKLDKENIEFATKKVNLKDRLKVQIETAKTKKTQALELLNKDFTDNPEKYEIDEAKITEIKEKLSKDVAEQKAYIKEIKEDNKFKGETYATMKKIQMIFQDPISSLNPRMTVREIIAEGLRISGMHDSQKITEKVHEVLKMVGLVPEHAFRYPHEFSGGQRQRIGIARALVVDPELLIADEPISALDVSIQAQVINLLRDLREELKLTILFIAHDLSVVKFFSDRIGVMYFGKMVELAPADKLFKNPLHPYTRSLLSAIPQPDPDYEKTRKRFTYNPAVDHNYGPDNQPEFREIEDGHFVLASDEEFNELKKNIK